MNNEIKLIEKYEQISELITANLKKGVRTNTAMSREEYEREISNGDLIAGETPQGLIILRNRPSHVKLNYYINDTDSSLDMSEINEAVCAAGWSGHGECCNNKCEQERPSPDKQIVTETAFRERDAALKETVEYLAGCGFEEILSRVRLSRPAGSALNNKDEKMQFYVRSSMLEDAAYINKLLYDSFDPVTGCLPEDDELHSDAAAGNILMLIKNDTELCGILHYKAAKKSAEIKHLAISQAYRGYGLSTILINEFLGKCKDMKTTVWTGSNNAAALNAYKDCGFTEDGRRSSVMIYKSRL